MRRRVLALLSSRTDEPVDREYLRERDGEETVQTVRLLDLDGAVVAEATYEAA